MSRSWGFSRGLPDQTGVLLIPTIRQQSPGLAPHTDGSC